MDHALGISIAGIAVSLDLAGCRPAIATRIREHYGAFLIEPEPATRRILVSNEIGDPYLPLPNGGPLQIETERRDGRVSFQSHYERGEFDGRVGKGELVLRGEGDPENFLRVLYGWWLLDTGGLLIHAAGVIRRDKGYVFFGASGSGKTTISSLSSGDTVLSDDMVIVKKEAGCARVYGVPFRGDLPEGPRTNASAALAGMYTLVKDVDHGIRALATRDAVARLSACVPFVMAHPASAAQVLAIGEELVRQVPVRELHFRRDHGFWRVIDGE